MRTLTLTTWRKPALRRPSFALNRALGQLKKHILLNILPTLLIIAVLGWLTLLIGEQIHQARQSLPQPPLVAKQAFE